MMEGKAEAETQKPTAGSQMAEIISSVCFKYRTQDSVYNQTKALCEIDFDGSKSSLQEALASSTTCEKLREFGMQRTISFIISAIPDLHESENLEKIEEILVLHDNNLLIRISNKTPETDKRVMQLDIRSVMKAIDKQGSAVPANVVHEKRRAEFADWAVSSLAYVKEKLSSPVVVAVAVGTALGVVSYYTFR